MGIDDESFPKPMVRNRDRLIQKTAWIVSEVENQPGEFSAVLLLKLFQALKNILPGPLLER